MHTWLYICIYTKSKSLYVNLFTNLCTCVNHVKIFILRKYMIHTCTQICKEIYVNLYQSYTIGTLIHINMSVLPHIYMCVCECTHVRMYMCVCTCTYVRMYISMSVCIIGIYECIYVLISIYTPGTLIHIHISILPHIYMCVYIYMYVCTLVYVYVSLVYLNVYTCLYQYTPQVPSYT